MLVVAQTPSGTVSINSTQVSKINVITQGNSMWTPEDATHIKPKGGQKINAEWIELDTVTENNYVDGDKAKVDKLIKDGDGTKYLSDDGTYDTIDLSGKVDVVAGKELSDNNYTDADVTAVGTIADKVDKVTGKELSANDFTDALETKLNGIDASANNYTHPANHAASVITQDSSNRFVSDTEKGKWNTKAIAFYVDGALTVDTKLCSIIAPFAMTITEIRVAVDTAPTGANLIVDVNKNGTTLYTTQDNRPTITATNTSATATDPDVTSIAVGDIISIDVDQIGSTIAGENLMVIVICEV